MIAKLKMLSKFPPGVLYRKALNKFKTRREHHRYLRHILPTDPRNPQKSEARSLVNIEASYFSSTQINCTSIDANTAEWLLSRYREKRFDLLGSGWVHNRYDSEALGLEGNLYPNSLRLETDAEGLWIERIVSSAHVPFSRELWKWIKETDPNYEPIDWQRDFKSGFRWDARIDYSEQRKIMEGRIGIDLKVPWELSRLQHLPQMAVLSERLGRRKEFVSEYLCQTLDFILSNPIGMGVNFNCPMDIGIRVANMTLAFDLFRDVFEPDTIVRFKPILAQYILESCRHIAHDMEYREGLTSNHYLGNVLGLLFGGAYLNTGEIQDQFLAYGVQELQRCMDRQFFDDGGNFEGSTSYHRLSGEMMALGAALLLRFGEEQRKRLMHYNHHTWNFAGPLFPAHEQIFDAASRPILAMSFYTKLAKSAQFSRDITKPGGDVPQFGDNDSGRFFRLSPSGMFLSVSEAKTQFQHIPPTYWDHFDLPEFWNENALDHRPFIALVEGIFNHETTIDCLPEISIGSLSTHASELKQNTNMFIPTASFQLKKEQQFAHSSTHFIPLWNVLPEDRSIFYYPDFQILGIKTDALFVALVGVSNPDQHHSLSHVHNDKLQVELEYQGHAILRDPGTYLYTPIPEWRRKFRSVHAHNTAVVEGQEQNRPLEGRLGLFNMMRDVQFSAETLTDTSICGVIRYRDIVHRREVTLTESGIRITDSCNKTFKVNFEPFEFYSPGYGKRTNNTP